MKAITLSLAVVLIVTACGDDSSDPLFTTTTTDGGTTTTVVAPTTTTVPSATTTTPPATTTTVASTTTAASTTTTTLPPTTTTTVPGSPFTAGAYGFFPDPLGTGADGHGSGCVIAGTVLTDGMWFGFVDAIGGGAVTFDLACFFTGVDGWNAAADDGEVGYDLDFYIRNQNPLTFSVPLDASGTAYWLDATGDLSPLPIAMTDWPQPLPPDYQACPDPFCSVWLYVNGGVATELIEQYLP